MDTKPRSEVRTPQVEVAELRSEDRKLRLVIRWLIVAIAVLTVAVMTLGAALIVESGSEEAAPTPTTVAEPTAGAGGEVWSEDMFMPAGFERADRDQVRHVDRGLKAFRNDDWVHFACGGSDCGGDIFRPALYYYDRTQGWRSFGNVFEAVGSLDVERTSPVVLLAETPASGSWGSWTVAFSVRAGTDEQLWIQHWEDPWGDWLQEMWVI